MTREEHMTLSDAINVAHIITEHADCLMQTMLDDYFGKFDSEEKGDAVYIHFYFQRMRAFAFMLREKLNAITETLPAVEWVDALKCEEETT